MAAENTIFYVPTLGSNNRNIDIKGIKKIITRDWSRYEFVDRIERLAILDNGITHLAMGHIGAFSTPFAIFENWGIMAWIVNATRSKTFVGTERQKGEYLALGGFPVSKIVK